MTASRRLFLAAAAAAATLTGACHRGPSDSDAEGLVRRYNELVTQAYRAGDYRIAEPVVGPDELRKLAAHIGVRIDQGMTLDARMLDFAVRRVQRPGEEVVVETEERWTYVDRRMGSGEQLGAGSTDRYVMSYHLRASGRRWIVDRISFLERPVVGSPRPAAAIDARSMHGFDEPARAPSATTGPDARRAR